MASSGGQRAEVGVLVVREAPRMSPTQDGVLVIDEHGDRKWGKKPPTWAGNGWPT